MAQKEDMAALTRAKPAGTSVFDMPHPLVPPGRRVEDLPERPKPIVLSTAEATACAEAGAQVHDALEAELDTRQLGAESSRGKRLEIEIDTSVDHIPQHERDAMVDGALADLGHPVYVARSAGAGATVVVPTLCVNETENPIRPLVISEIPKINTKQDVVDAFGAGSEITNAVLENADTLLIDEAAKDSPEQDECMQRDDRLDALRYGLDSMSEIPVKATDETLGINTEKDAVDYYGAGSEGHIIFLRMELEDAKQEAKFANDIQDRVRAIIGAHTDESTEKAAERLTRNLADVKENSNFVNDVLERVRAVMDAQSSESTVEAVERFRSAQVQKVNNLYETIREKDKVIEDGNAALDKVRAVLESYCGGASTVDMVKVVMRDLYNAKAKVAFMEGQYERTLWILQARNSESISEAAARIGSSNEDAVRRLTEIQAHLDTVTTERDQVIAALKEVGEVLGPRGSNETVGDTAKSLMDEHEILRGLFGARITESTTEAAKRYREEYLSSWRALNADTARRLEENRTHLHAVEYERDKAMVDLGEVSGILKSLAGETAQDAARRVVAEVVKCLDAIAEMREGRASEAWKRADSVVEEVRTILGAREDEGARAAARRVMAKSSIVGTGLIPTEAPLELRRAVDLLLLAWDCYNSWKWEVAEHAVKDAIISLAKWLADFDGCQALGLTRRVAMMERRLAEAESKEV